MKLNELYTGDNGIFQKVFNPVFPVLYQTIFGSDNPVLVDAYVRMHYGEKELLNSITGDNANETIQTVITVLFDEWSKQIQVFNLEYDVLNPVKETTSTTTTTNVDETGNNNTVDSTTAFNNGDFNNDSRQQRDTTGNRQEKSTQTSTKSGNTGSLPVSQVIEKEMRLRAYNFKKKVISDIVNEITISIYN